MKVRFVLPSDDDEPLFDRTLDLPAVPAPGETVGITADDDSKARAAGMARLVFVEYRRWFIDEHVDGGSEPLVEVWLTALPGDETQPDA